MSNLSKNMLIDISVKMSSMENIGIAADSSPEGISSFTSLFKEFRDDFTWFYEKIPSIDPSIDEKEIKKFIALFLWYFSLSLN